MKIALEIASCSDCRFLKTSEVYTGDSFEHVENWECSKACKVIKLYVETFDKVKIPDWCPCKVLEK